MSKIDPDTIIDEFNDIIAYIQDKRYSESEFREFYEELIKGDWQYNEWKLYELMNY